MKDQYEAELSEWINDERLALELLETASKLQFDKSAELVLFRRRVFDKKVSEIINDHAYAKKFTGLNIPLSLTLGLTQAIAKLDLAPSRMTSAGWQKNILKRATRPISTPLLLPN